MNDPNPIREQSSKSELVPENLAMADESSLPARKKLPLEEQPNKKEIDLNELFPDAETNLNDLFPDAEVKHLLKSITKNKKDMSAIKERLTNENETSDEDEQEELTANGSSISDKTENNKTTQIPISAFRESNDYKWELPDELWAIRQV